MFICDQDQQEAYIAYMQHLKEQSRKRRERDQELILQDWNQQLRQREFLSSLRSHFNARHSERDSASDQKKSSPMHALKEFSPSNYFHEERIAVYTCIIGAYDQLINPELKPDNIDYYVITDQRSSESVWTSLDLSPIKKKLSIHTTYFLIITIPFI